MSDEAKEEEEEALLEKINFPLLCRDFKRYYSEFDAALQRTPFANPEYGAVCFTTFGLTGVGKSTLLARLVSNLSPDEFIEAIEDRSRREQYVTIDEITIGHSRNSTTVVPQIFSVGPIHACDMPGFAETDTGKRICIDVLQKCFLTGVRNIRLLIVVDIAAIDELRLQTLRNGYHEALRTLLGPNYDESINHFYFVFTKNEELGYDNEAINEKMMKIVYDLSDGKDPAALKFFKRMAVCHVVVDLRTDDKDGLLRKLQELIEADETDKKRLSKVATWDVKSLKAGENRINKLCLLFVERVTKKQRLIKQDSDALHSQTESTKKDISEQSQALSKEIAEKELALKQAEEKLKKTKDAIEQYPRQKSQILSSLDESKHLLEVQKREAKSFQETFINRDLVNFRCDISRPSPKKKKLRQEQETYMVEINADVMSDDSRNRMVLVMEYEEDDGTLKKHIGNGSLIPDKLEDLHAVTGPRVLYNNVPAINKDNCCKVNFDSKTGVQNIAVTYRLMFKVYIFSASTFKNLRFFNGLQKTFNIGMKQNEEKIKRLASKLEDLESSHEANVEEEVGLRDNVGRARLALKIVVDKTKKQGQIFFDKCENLKDMIRQLRKRIDNLLDDALIQNIREIDEIFRKNNLETELSGHLEVLSDEFGPLERGSIELLDAISRFQIENDGLMKKLLLGAEPLLLVPT